jgi:hypothetical protein
MAPKDGNIGEKGLRAIHNQVMGEGFPDFSLEVNFYEHFIYGKQNHVRFSSGDTREKWIFELTHSNVFGPVPIPSLRGSMYYVSFIYYFSRKTWLYFLGKKYEVFDKLEELKSIVENQT